MAAKAFSECQQNRCNARMTCKETWSPPFFSAYRNACTRKEASRYIHTWVGFSKMNSSNPPRKMLLRTDCSSFLPKNPKSFMCSFLHDHLFLERIESSSPTALECLHCDHVCRLKAFSGSIPKTAMKVLFGSS